MPCATEDFEYVEKVGLIRHLETQGQLVESRQVDRHELGTAACDARYVLEHPRLPFVSYPYEWSFSGLKAASLLHLDVHLAALEYGVTLSDASAYNVQFLGPNPVFIDRLSFQRYHDGDYWIGHRQFCEQFLNPLLLRALLGVPHNAWYRGAQEGISSGELARLLPWVRKLSWKVMTHVVLPASFQRQASNKHVIKEVEQYRRHKLPLSTLKRMLTKLRDWIASLQPSDGNSTVWSDYASSHSYSPEEKEKKQRFVREFLRSKHPRMVWDFGCNTGDYTVVALAGGAEHVIGFDMDQGSLETAFSRAMTERLNFLPLFFDAVNPSPNQGWAESERRGLRSRASADALLALAFVHHLVIGKNVPLSEAVGWLIDLAPNGVIEFVPKSDPMVQRMLRLRKDIFDSYTEAGFLQEIEKKAVVAETLTVSSSGRRLIAYSRH
jgi:ribosomal protein L11 methylase PrmA